MPAAAPSWEVTLLRRPPGGKRARVAGRVVVQAADFDRARAAAEAALRERAGGTPTGGSGWSLGVLRPLTPRAPGTHRYRVTFAVWTSDADRFVRQDVHELDVWRLENGKISRQWSYSNEMEVLTQLGVVKPRAP